MTFGQKDTKGLLPTDQIIEQLVESIKKEEKRFNEAVQQNAMQVLKSLEEPVMNKVDEMVAEALKDMKVPIVVNEVKLGEVDLKNKHQEFANSMRTLLLFKKLLLVGPTGSGKTTIAGQIAKELKLNYAKYSCNDESTKYELTGFERLDGSYLEPDFINLYKNGGVFLVDEYDAMPNSMALFFNGIIDDSSEIYLPFKGETITKHKDFYIIFSGNTHGTGSFEYNAREAQDKALLDRLKMCKVWIDYDPVLEKIIAGAYYAQLIALRKNLTKIGYYLSTRNMADIVKHCKGIKVPIAESIELFIQDIPQEERKSLKQ